MKIIQHKGRQLKRLLKDESIIKEKIDALKKEYEAEVFKIEHDRDLKWSKVHNEFMEKRDPLNREIADILVQVHKLKKEILELSQGLETMTIV